MLLSSRGRGSRMRKPKVIKDKEYYKKKLETTISNVSALMGFGLSGFLIYKLSSIPIASLNGLVILLSIVGILALWSVSIDVFEALIKRMVFGKSKKRKLKENGN